MSKRIGRPPVKITYTDMTYNNKEYTVGSVGPTNILNGGKSHRRLQTLRYELTIKEKTTMTIL